MIENKFESLTDEQLVEQATNGCLESFERLVSRFQVPLVQFLSRRVAVEDAEDLTQEAFVRAYHNLHRYQSKWRFSTWLFTIARRLCINHLRQRKVRYVVDGTSTDSMAEVKGSGVEAGEMIAAREQRQYLWDRAAKILSEPKFTALWLFYVEDVPIREIAQVLGRTRVAVKTMMFRARQELAPILAVDESVNHLSQQTAEFEVSFLTRIKTRIAESTQTVNNQAATTTT